VEEEEEEVVEDVEKELLGVVVAGVVRDVSCISLSPSVLSTLSFPSLVSWTADGGKVK